MGTFVSRWLGPRNIGEGEILRCAQNDGSFEVRADAHTKFLTLDWGRIIVTASRCNDCSSECDYFSVRRFFGVRLSAERDILQGTVRVRDLQLHNMNGARHCWTSAPALGGCGGLDAAAGRSGAVNGMR